MRSEVELYIEGAPLALNKTAVYRLLKDIGTVFSNRISWLFLGRQYEVSKISQTSTRYFCFRLAVKFSLLFVFFERLFKIIFLIQRPSKKIFFIDPVYVLFNYLRDDDIVMIQDLSTITVVDWHGFVTHRLYRGSFERLERSKCKLIAVSQSTADDLVANFIIDPKRIIVLPHYLPELNHFNDKKEVSIGESENTIGRFEEDEKYFLFVGSLEIRKNVHRLITAFNMSGLQKKGFRLKIVGSKGFGSSCIKTLAKISPGIEISEFCSDSELKKYYQNAFAFIYPSLQEGFGFPLLEALSYGLPCVSTVTGASPEIGEDFVLYVDPCNLEAISNSFHQIIERRSEFIAKVKDRRAHIFEKYSKEVYFKKLATHLFC